MKSPLLSGAPRSRPAACVPGPRIGAQLGGALAPWTMMLNRTVATTVVSIVPSPGRPC